ncbi:MAG: uracil-DNA glycosylase [Pseudobdellovibrionaceae bacterium]
MSEIKIEASWKKRLESEFSKPYMTQLKAFLLEEKKRGKIIYPPAPKIFASFDETPFDKVKVVILGQDPYHGPNQAHGLSFSVQTGVRFPPSLKNILKELKSDLGCEIPKDGTLTKWAHEGVLLLNSVLTVEEGNAASHQKKGWETFTDSAIRSLNEEKKHVVYILWGSYAQKKASFVDHENNCVIENVHPSPLSSHRGFFGSKPFSKTNDYLRAHGIKPIDWNLT